MIEKLNGHRFSLGVTIAIGTQIVGGLLYFNSLVTTLNHTAEQVEELTTLTKQLNGRLTKIEFEAERNFSLNKFLTDNMNEEIEDLEDALTSLERTLMTR